MSMVVTGLLSLIQFQLSSAISPVRAAPRCTVARSRARISICGVGRRGIRRKEEAGADAYTTE